MLSIYLFNIWIFFFKILLNDRLREDPEKPSVEQQYMQLLDEREHLLGLYFN